MRSYPRNSPEAAARLIALVLISDGHVCRSEIDALNSLEIEGELGLASGAFARVIHTLCEDLLMGAVSGGSMLDSVDESALAALMREVDEPALRAKVVSLATAAALADRHVSDGETVVMAAARTHWQLGDDAWAEALAAHPKLQAA